MEEWFERLPAERQAEMLRQQREEVARMEELVELDKRRMWIESLRMGAVFLVGDSISPGGGFWSAVVALLAGTLAGFLLNRFDAKRGFSAVVGGGTFFALECLLRGGFLGGHLLLCYPLTAACAVIGYFREERGT